MIQAPEPGMDVEVVPADFGAEFAGAIRVNPAQAAAVAARVQPDFRGELVGGGAVLEPG